LRAVVDAGAWRGKACALVFAFFVYGCRTQEASGTPDAGALATLDVDVERLDLGHPATSAELDALGATVLPDGTGLPTGQGSARQGEEFYRGRCAACHGARGEGAAAVPLVGTERRANGYRVGRAPPGQPRPSAGDFIPYATTLFDYTKRAMPPSAPGSLSDAEAYGVVAWILYLNGAIGKDDVLDRAALPKVRMPARERFVYED
jgi:cytochrome c